MGKRKTTRRKKRKTARDFGDNPHIRRRYGEAKQSHKQEPWEVQYRKSKGKMTFYLRKKK